VNHPETAHEHEFEAAHGLPELLPDGEKILWQGAPDWRTLAIQVMHVRTLAIYFAAMLLWRGGTVLSDTGSLLAALVSIAIPTPLALLALGLMTLFAWLTSRTTVYTLTNRRVVMRIGIVLSVTFNLPYRMIESVSLRTDSKGDKRTKDANGAGDIALLLAASDKIAYANLWPHARPWRVKRPEPMLRAVPQSARVGQLLATAIGNAPVAATTTRDMTAANDSSVDKSLRHSDPLTA
jgi:Bacterial PH domain